MRINTNPFRKKINNLNLSTFDHTVCIITYIPFLEGYYKHKLDVLKVCINSLIKNTETNFNLLIFDNNSCQQVTNYLHDLKLNFNFIDIYFSNRNIGKIAGLNKLLKIADGNLITISDDDIFFKKDWLKETIKIIKDFNNVGYVSCIPVRSSFEKKKFDKFRKFNHEIEIIDQWDEKIDRIFSKSIGVSPIEYLNKHKSKKIQLIKKDKTKTYLCGTHLQFTTTRKVLNKILPFEESNLNYQANLIDVPFDKRELFRLATQEMFIEHMGTNLDKKIYFEYLNSNLKKNKYSVTDRLTFIQKVQLSIFNFSIIKTMMKKMINYFHYILYLQYIKKNK